MRAAPTMFYNWQVLREYLDQLSHLELSRRRKGCCQGHTLSQGQHWEWNPGLMLPTPMGVGGSVGEGLSPNTGLNLLPGAPETPVLGPFPHQLPPVSCPCSQILCPPPGTASCPRGPRQKAQELRQEPPLVHTVPPAFPSFKSVDHSLPLALGFGPRGCGPHVGSLQFLPSDELRRLVLSGLPHPCPASLPSE